MKKVRANFNELNWIKQIAFVEVEGNHVVSVEFNKGFKDPKQLKEILKFTPNIEELSIRLDERDNGDVAEAAGRDGDDSLRLEKLQTLNIKANDVATKQLMCILKNSTSSIKKFIFETDRFKEPVTEIGDFLSLQTSLEEINVTSTFNLVHYSMNVVKSIFTEQLSGMEYLRLKTLKIKAELEFNELLSDFLKVQAKNVEKLELHKVDFNYYRLIFKDFTNLRKLKFIPGLIDDLRVEEIKVFRLPSLIELHLENIRDHTVFCSVIEMFLNLEVLTVDRIDCNIKSIMEYLPKLKRLAAKDLSLEAILMAKSSSLVALEMYVNAWNISLLWENLAENFPNIERLVILRIGLHKLAKTQHKEVGIILRNLRLFKKLNFCVIEYCDMEQTICKDHDNPELGNDINPLALERFSFMLFRTCLNRSTITMNDSFNRKHAENIDILEEDYGFIYKNVYDR